MLLQVFSSERLQDKKSWVQAQGACQDLGAQLLSLASYEEEHFVANMLNKLFGYKAWGGGLCACVWLLVLLGRGQGDSDSSEACPRFWSDLYIHY